MTGEKLTAQVGETWLVTHSDTNQRAEPLVAKISWVSVDGAVIEGTHPGKGRTGPAKITAGSYRLIVGTQLNPVQQIPGGPCFVTTPIFCFIAPHRQSRRQVRAALRLRVIGSVWGLT